MPLPFLRHLSDLRLLQGRKQRRGFTLIEVLLTTSIIGGLSVAIITGVNPARILAKGRNTERHAAINDLLGAITVYTIDQDGTLPPQVFLPSVPGPTTFSGARVIGGTFDGAQAVYVTDIDGDADPDVVAVRDGGSGEVSFFERGGTPPGITWTKRIIDASFRGNDVEARDMDGDSLIDVVALDTNNNRVSWWKNQGGTPATFGARVNIETGYFGVRTLSLADMDADGDTDVVGARNFFIWDAVRWWRNSGTPLVSPWSYKKIEDSFFFYNVSEAHAVDMDGDGDRDVLGGGYYVRLYWWENDGDPWQNGWTRYQIDTSSPNVRGVTQANVDGDADQDVVGISTSGRVKWWENDGNPKKNDWTARDIATNMGGESIAAADMDGDSDVDVVGASSGGDKLAWWENKGVLGFSGTSVIENGPEADAIEDIFLADIDGDTDFDVVAAMRTADTVAWWENLRIAGQSPAAGAANIGTEYKPICKPGTSTAECDANGGVALDVLIPQHIAELPIDPLADPATVTTGYEVRMDPGTPILHISAPLAELGEAIELKGSVGVENCLVWNILSGERVCVLFD